MLLLPNLNTFGHHFREVLDMHTPDEDLLRLYAYFNEEIAKDLLEVKPFYDEPQMQHILACGSVMRTYIKLTNIFEERTKVEQFYILHNVLNAFTPSNIQENLSVELYYRSTFERLFHFFRIAKTMELAAIESKCIIQQYNKIFAYIV